ncbi:MAG: N-acetyltransferase, partial [Gammaproteobacteria bacterium]|nr:N-acetyltransferase [Gammaproteobacteria bacterium]
TLLAATEADIGRAGGTRVYADTSSRTQYEPTRAFYRRAGYQQAAHFPDFYGPGDGKIVFLRVLSAT